MHVFAGLIFSIASAVDEAAPAVAIDLAVPAKQVCNARMKCFRPTHTTRPLLVEADPDRKPPTAPAYSANSSFKRQLEKSQRRQGTQIIESVMPDGRRMSKVITPYSTYCAYKESNALTKGRDVMQSGVRTMITSCP